MEFFFVRHGESAHNAAGLFCGGVDSPLTAEGQMQAVRAAETLAGERFDWVASSPLQRALDTAMVIAADRDVELIVDPRLAEHCKGVMEGTPYRKMRSREWLTVADAESMTQLFVRVSAALADLSERPGRGVVVSHAGVARAVECLKINGDPWLLYDLPKVGNACPYLVSLEVRSAV